MSYKAMQRHGGTLNANYSVKEVNLKRLQTIWLQSNDILEKAKLWRQIKRPVIARLECGVGWIGRWQRFIYHIHMIFKSAEESFPYIKNKTTT